MLILNNYNYFSQIQNNSISFKKRSENVRIGEDVLYHYQKTHPDVLPVTKTIHRLLNKIDRINIDAGMKILDMNARKNQTLGNMRHRINTERQQVSLEPAYEKNPAGAESLRCYDDKDYEELRKKGDMYQKLEAYVKIAENNIRRSKVTNCQEIAQCINLELIKRGVKPHVIGFATLSPDKKRIIDHAFNVFGLKKDANLSKPTTWGSQAVVVDGWLGVAKPANQALEEMFRFFQYPEGTHKKTTFVVVDTKF